MREGRPWKVPLSALSKTRRRRLPSKPEHSGGGRQRTKRVLLRALLERNIRIDCVSTGARQTLKIGADSLLGPRRRRADSTERSKRCRTGVAKTCTSRSRSNTRSSARKCKATSGTTESLETSPVSRNSGGRREKSRSAGSRGVAVRGLCRGRISYAWRSGTVFRVHGWSTVC